jgi:uncharacterized membrane protein
VQPIEQAKRPVTGLAGRYGHPLHPALVALPIGAWVASFAFDLASHLVSDPAALVEGSRWLIGLGVLGALVAAAVGFLDLLGLPAGTRVFRTAIWHMALMLAAVAGYGVGFLLRGTGPADPAGPVGWGELALSAATLAILGIGGFLGGTLAFRYGVRVADEATQAAGYRPLTTRTHAKENSGWESPH